MLVKVHEEDGVGALGRGCWHVATDAVEVGQVHKHIARRAAV